MKPIRLTRHAMEQAVERGTDEAQITEAILKGSREPAKHGRDLCRYSFPFGETWKDNFYEIKQVVPVIVEESEEIVVITVYTFSDLSKTGFRNG